MKVEQVRKASNIAEIISFGSYNNIYILAASPLASRGFAPRGNKKM